MGHRGTVLGWLKMGHSWGIAQGTRPQLPCLEGPISCDSPLISSHLPPSQVTCHLRWNAAFIEITEPY